MSAVKGRSTRFVHRVMARIGGYKGKVKKGRVKARVRLFHAIASRVYSWYLLRDEIRKWSSQG